MFHLPRGLSQVRVSDPCNTVTATSRLKGEIMSRSPMVGVIGFSRDPSRARSRSCFKPRLKSNSQVCFMALLWKCCQVRETLCPVFFSIPKGDIEIVEQSRNSLLDDMAGDAAKRGQSPLGPYKPDKRWKLTIFRGRFSFRSQMLSIFV